MDILAGIDRACLMGQSTLNGELSKQEIYDILVQSIGGNPEYLLPSSLYRKIEKSFQHRKIHSGDDLATG